MVSFMSQLSYQRYEATEWAKAGTEAHGLVLGSEDGEKHMDWSWGQEIENQKTC